MSLLMPVSVSYDRDPDQVERVLLEEARPAAGEIHGLLAEPEPFVRFIPGFEDSSLDFTLICQAYAKKIAPREKEGVTVQLRVVPAELAR